MSILILINPVIQKPNHMNENVEKNKTFVVKRSADFEVTGVGENKNWGLTEWITLRPWKISGKPLDTKVKVLYSKTGIYFLFNCEDRMLTATFNSDFEDLWMEDVVEVFLWPNEAKSFYFEYEISPLNHELPILISNENGDLVRWQPFHYDSDRRTRHKTSTQKNIVNSEIEGWIAEFFIPFKLLRPLENISPESGTRWRANMYRVDYDDGVSNWSWKLTDGSFHEYEKFGVFVFE